MGADLPEGGTLTPKVMAVLGRVDPKIEVTFYPWRRTVLMGLEGDNFVGYFPEYDSDEIRQRCYLSAAVGVSEVGFAYRQTSSFDWETSDDLSHYRVGVVAGYFNERRLDELIQRGIVRTEASKDDLTNVHKLISARVDVIAIDRDVLQYLLTTRPELAHQQARVQFHPRLLARQPLYLCFRKNERGKSLRDGFNAAWESSSRKPTR